MNDVKIDCQASCDIMTMAVHPNTFPVTMLEIPTKISRSTAWEATASLSLGLIKGLWNAHALGQYITERFKVPSIILLYYAEMPQLWNGSTVRDDIVIILHG